ncbi:cupin domain-containing protein [Citrobacter farmeri]|nr:cupin domain-containing protein [Citrobacter farmeri]GJL46471.1 hypothetical protein TUM17580_25300 [Citrobacter farmeri]
MTFIAAIPLATIIREYESATLRLTLPVPTDDDDSRHQRRHGAGRQPDNPGEIMNTQFEGNGIFPKGPKNEAYAQYFQGTSYLNMLSTQGVNIGNVVFEPGCRNHWHIHHKGGQILLVTGGRGWYQEWNKPAQPLVAGDVVNIPPGVKHWHGAAADSWFAHLAIEVPAQGASNEWLEPVSEETYAQLP